jgi:hypothetical protein
MSNSNKTDDALFNAASGHGDDWGIDNLSTAYDHGRAIMPTPPVVYKTPFVTAYQHSDEGDFVLTSGDWNV